MIKILHRLVSMTGKYKTRIRASYVTSFIKGFLMKAPLMISFIMIMLFMRGEMDKSKCLYLGLIMAGAVILQMILEHATNVLQSATGYMIFADMRMKLGDHLRKLPMGYFTEGNMGKISSVLATDMVFIEENCMGVLATVVTFMISQFIMIVMMFFMDIRLGILSAVVTGAFIIVGNLMLKSTLEHSAEKQEKSEKLSNEVLDFAEGMGIIKSYNLLGEKSKRLTHEFEESCRASIGFEVDYTPWSRALNLTFGIGTSLTFALSAYLYVNGLMTAEYMVGMTLFILDLFIAVKSYYGEMPRLTVTAAALDRIEEVFAADELEDNGKENVDLTIRKSSPVIEYKDVTFGYTDSDVLKNVSFKMNYGDMTALVGPSGGGKSTIASLLARFWDIKSGSILVDGKDIRDISLGSLMDNISMVFQRVYLFKDTIYNNIAISRPDATREEVIEAARKARCLEFIDKLPEGFDTVIGEGGASLSGGEQQRISIARCILKDSPIVILDEATASVDADNERAIQQAISELCMDKTLLVIAHRLKTIRDADQILVVSGGEIIERGDHEELMILNGKYASMVTLQAG